MSKVIFMAVGDTAPYVEPPESIFERIKGVLATADIRFAQAERTFSDRGNYQEFSLSPHTRVSPHLVRAYSATGFDLVGLGNNHTMDWGQEAVVDTIKHFREKGIAPLGIGANIQEARTPTILERKGIRIGFLAYCSVLLPQYWATESRAGCAPVRAYTYYTPYEFQPGSPARITTIAERTDVEAMVEDIKKLRSQVDIVVCSMHWGVHWIPRYIADYQIEVGHAAIDAGCDLIIGHHAHVLKGVEVYRGKPIIYSLGNCAMSRGPLALNFLLPEGRFRFNEVYDIPIGPDFTYGHRDYYNHSAIAKAEFTKDRGVELSLMPVYIEPGPKPTVLKPEDKRFTEIARLIQWSSEIFGTKLEVKDGVLRLM